MAIVRDGDACVRRAGIAVVHRVLEYVPCPAALVGLSRRPVDKKQPVYPGDSIEALVLLPEDASSRLSPRSPRWLGFDSVVSARKSYCCSQCRILRGVHSSDDDNFSFQRGISNALSGAGDSWRVRLVRCLPAPHSALET